MVTSVTLQVGAEYATGTTVSVYNTTNSVPVTPIGSVVMTGVVRSNGTITFAGLTSGVTYLAYAASGTPKYVQFYVPPALPESPPGTGSGLSAAGVYVNLGDLDGIDRTGVTSSFAAVQNAIDEVHAAGGGIVFVPAGTYLMDDELVHHGGVHLMGAMAFGTHFVWRTDLGAGKFACKPGGDAIQGDAGTISQLRMIGPGELAIGTQLCDMDGVFPGQSVEMEHVTISNFRANLWIGQDHQVFKHCQFDHGYYNVLFASARESKGNHTFYNCELQGAGRACVACEGRNTLDFCTFIGGQVGYAPYGFYKFDGPMGPSTDAFMNSCLLLNLAMEGIGNAGFWDESTGSGSGADSMLGCRIENPGIVMDYSQGPHDPALSTDYTVKLRNVTNSKIVQGSQGFGRFTTPDIGVFMFDAGGADIEGAIVPKMFAPGCAGGSTVRQADSYAVLFKAKGTVTIGDVVEASYEQSVSVRRYSAQNLPFAGVAATAAADGEAVLITREGDAQVRIAAGGNPGNGTPLRPDPTTTYQASAAPGYTFGDPALATAAPVIGFIRAAANAGDLGTMAIQHSYDRNYIRPSVVASLPTAAVAYRGQLVRLEGAAGVADTLYICEKNSSNNYAWRAI